MKVYIAGPMAGILEYNRPAFHQAAAEIAKAGHIALNPAILPGGLSQGEYMDICCAMVRCSDAVYMLKGWENSEGAVIEHALARKIGLVIEYQVGAV